MKDAALSGVTVVDLSQFEAGPSCTEALAWHGADVIKVEAPWGGDPGRRAMTDRFDMDSLYFILLNANKKSVTCNLKDDAGREVLRRLVEKADVVVENFGPGVIEKLGFGWERIHAINPRCIFAQIKGFAPDGPYRDYLSFDMIAQATGGVMSITGEPEGEPVRPAATIGDTGTGLHMAVSIVSALYQRMRTGEGQHLHVAMQDAMLNYCRVSSSRQILMDEAVPRLGNSVVSGAPAGLFPCNGGGPNDYCYIYVHGDHHWARFCGVIGREDLAGDPRYADGAERLAHKAEVEALVTHWTHTRTKRDVMESMGGAGVPAGAVFDMKELMESPDMIARGIVATVEHPERGEVPVPAWPVKLSGSRVPVSAAPLLGQHNEQIYGDLLGMSAADVAGLRETGAM